MYLVFFKYTIQVVRKAKDDEWIKLRESLQHDFVKNQRSLWVKTIKSNSEGESRSALSVKLWYKY